MHRATVRNFTPANRRTGFTLIELMVTVAIVGVLAAISFPSYNAYVLRGKRAEGRNALMDIAARQERFYSDNNQYTGTIGGGGLGVADPCGDIGGTQTETCRYTITITDVTGTNQAYTLTAAPVQDDPACGDLELNQAGTKDAEGDVATCWGK